MKKIKKGEKPKKSNTNNNDSVGTSGTHMQGHDELDSPIFVCKFAQRKIFNVVVVIIGLTNAAIPTV